MHNRGRVHPETEQRVLQVIKDLDYRTNIFAKNLKLGKTFNFGVLMPRPEQDSRYWTLPLRGITRAQQELVSHNVKVKFFFFDRFREKSVLSAGKKLAVEKLDGLLAAPVLPESFRQVWQELPEKLPLVFFDSYVPEIKPLSFIGQDAFQSGLLVSSLMKRTVRKTKGKIAVVKVLPGDYHITERIRGFLRGCSSWPGFKTEEVEIEGKWPKTVTGDYLETFYRQNRDLAGIFVTNAMTHKVAEWWKANSGKGKIILIGYDPIPRNVSLLKQGVIDFLISQQSEKQGYEGIYTLFRKVVLGLPARARIMMQIDIITGENIDYYQS